MDQGKLESEPLDFGEIGEDKSADPAEELKEEPEESAPVTNEFDLSINESDEDDVVVAEEDEIHGKDEKWEAWQEFKRRMGKLDEAKKEFRELMYIDEHGLVDFMSSSKTAQEKGEKLNHQQETALALREKELQIKGEYEKRRVDDIQKKAKIV